MGESSVRANSAQARELSGSSVHMEGNSPLPNHQNLATYQEMRSSHLQDADQWQGTYRWEAEKGSHVSLWSSECWEEPPKMQIPRLLGYLKSYWKFQSSRVMTGKGSSPSGWLFYESIPKPTDQQLSDPYLSFSSLSLWWWWNRGERNFLLLVLATLSAWLSLLWYISNWCSLPSRHLPSPPWD